MPACDDEACWVFLAAYPCHSFQLHSAADRRYCPWFEPKWFQGLPGHAEIIPDDVSSFSSSRHWVNSDKGPLLRLLLLAKVKPRLAHVVTTVWSEEELLWHRHLLEAPDAFSLLIQACWKVSEAPYVYTEVAPADPGGLRPFVHRRLLLKAADLPPNLHVQPLCPDSDDDKIPLDRLTQTSIKPSDIWVVMVPQQILARIAAARWSFLVCLARFLPGARNMAREDRAKKRYVPMFRDFPDVTWLRKSMQALKELGQGVQNNAPPTPLFSKELRALAGNLQRWMPCIMSSKDPDDIEMHDGERALLHSSIAKLLGWAACLDDLMYHSLQLRGRKVYSAGLLLRAFRNSLLLRNKGQLLDAVQAAADVLYPGLFQAVDKDEVESVKVPSQSHLKRCHFSADLCFIEFERRTRARVSEGYVMFGWADSTPLKRVWPSVAGSEEGT